MQTNYTHIQFRLTEAQIEALQAKAPPGMSANQAAKYLLLQKVTPAAAKEMQARLGAGLTRLTA